MNFMKVSIALTASDMEFVMGEFFAEARECGNCTLEENPIENGDVMLSASILWSPRPLNFN